MKALVVQADRTVKVQEKPTPVAEDDKVVIKIAAIGVNPTDWKHARFIASEGDIIGCDATGDIATLGPKVPASSGLGVGSRVGFFTRGGQSQTHAAFAEYVAMPYDLVFKIPDNVTYEQAATIPIPFFTAVQALFHRLKLPEPTSGEPLPASDKWLLVWSGATSVGQYAIQLGKLAGFKVATTASESNWPLLKNLGADVVFDYKDKDVVSKLKAATNDSIEYGLDTVITDGSTNLAANAFSPKGGHIAVILPCAQSDISRTDVKVIETLVYTALTGKSESFGSWACPGGPEDRTHYVKWLQLAPKIFESGAIKFLPIQAGKGLENVQAGFDKLAENKVRAQKLVYTI